MATPRSSEFLETDVPDTTGSLDEKATVVQQDEDLVDDKVAIPQSEEEDRIDEKKGLEEIQSPQEASSESNGGEAIDHQYLSGKKLFFVFTGMLLSVFLVSLDQTIVATANPQIASRFNDLSQVTWIASGYFLTQASFILTYGQTLTIAPSKYIFLSAIGIFELGSLLCGVAPNMNVLIFGRAVAGVGGAGIFIAVLSMTAQISSLEKRPILFGAYGGVYALASVLGPLLGGVFTDHVTWRLCFYINLPFGLITVLTIVFLTKAEDPAPTESLRNLTAIQKWLNLDWVGSFLCLAMVTSILLPLQWGGNTKPWSDGSVIATFCVFGVLLPLWIVWEWYRGDNAILPISMLKNRTQIGSCLETFFLMLLLLVGSYYLPLFYQAKGHSATKSGIDILPFMICILVGAALSGAIINRTGRYWWFVVLSPLLSTIGCGLLFTMTSTTPNSRIIGYQILFGIGVGGAFQNTLIAIQAEYSEEEHKVPQATSITNFTQLVGGIIGIAIAGTIFANRLRTELPIFAPDISASQSEAVRESVTAIFTLPVELQDGVIKAYCRALGFIFLLGIPSGILGGLSGFMIRDNNLKTKGVKPTAGAA